MFRLDDVDMQRLSYGFEPPFVPAYITPILFEYYMAEIHRMRHHIKTTGEIVHIGKSTIDEIKKLIGADTLDQFTLADGLHVCFVDDLGHEKGLPYNHEATRRYLARCRPGTTHTIVGDVVIVPDSDFADPGDAGFSPRPAPVCTCGTAPDHHPRCALSTMEEMQS